VDLKERQVHLWLTDPFAIGDSSVVRSYARLLTEAERGRWTRYRFAKDRHAFLVTRALVRTVLSRYAAVEPAAWRFVENDYGRPEIGEPAAHRHLRFNLSHTAGLIACAVVADRDIGVDVEVVADRPLLDIASDFFAPDEVAALTALDPSLQTDRFYTYWTLKESYIKARGMGLAIPLDQFWFEVEGGARPTITIDPRQNDRADSWQFERWRPTPTHHLALAVRRQDEPDLEVRVRRCVPLGEASEPSQLTARADDD